MNGKKKKLIPKLGQALNLVSPPNKTTTQKEGKLPYPEKFSDKFVILRTPQNIIIHTAITNTENLQLSNHNTILPLVIN